MSKPRVAERRRSSPATAGRFARIVRLLRWPVVIVWLLAVVALYPAAHTLSSLANGTAAASLPSSAPSTRVVELEQGPGQPDVDTAIVVFVREAGLTAADLQTVASARASVVSPSGPVHGYASYSATLSVPPYSTAGYAAVANLRQRLDAGAPGSLLGGDPAVQYDITRATHRDTLLLIPLVLAVILVIIALLLRAVVAPLVLVATTALSFAASFGLASLLWRYGFGYDGIEAQLPMYIFIFLVALGVDYNIFLAARIREESASLGIGQGTLRGLAVTGGVITAAGIVMAATFSALTLIPAVAVAEVGVAVALGVLLDTVLVRTVLVPASLLIIGERVWWPRATATA